MAPKSGKVYEFANFRLDVARKVILRDGEPLGMTPKIFDTLEILVENAGVLLRKDEIMESVWRDHFVEESNLTSNIKTLRKALGDDAAKPRFIETVPRRGYRFIAEVKEKQDESTEENSFTTPVLPPIGKTAFAPRSVNRFLLSVATVLIAGLFIAGFWFARRQDSATLVPILSEPFAAEKLSTNGKVLHSTISPDGKTVVYTSGIEGKQSVWVRQLESGNNVEIIPPSDDFYYGLEISPDGRFLYFVRAPKSVSRLFDVYRIPIFGGIPVRIVGDAEGWISISPDGSRISFVRCYDRDDDYCSLSIADALDGKNEKKLVSRTRPNRIGDNQFSHDGRSIAFAVGQSETQANEFGLAEVNVESGAEKELTPQKFFNIRSLAWLPDKTGLLLAASRVPNKQFSIWQVSVTSDEITRLTNDSETYSELSLDREANSLVATQTKQDFRLYLMNFENPSVRRFLGDASGVAFAPDGKIISSSLMTGNDEIWSVNSDGSQRRQLTNSPADEVAAVISPDGSSIYFSSNRTGESHVWRMNSDGSNQTQLTTQTGGFPLFVSPDGQAIYYHHGLNKTLWRVSANGTEEKLILDKRSHHFAFSPDGLNVAFPDELNGAFVVTIFSLADSQTLKTFVLADQKSDLVQLRWSPDGQNLAYILADREPAGKTLWFQSLDGKAPRRIADLGVEQVSGSGFALAPDGKSFALVQGGWQHDAILLKGLK